MHPTSARPDDPVASLFGGKALVGVVHCPPFPGSSRYDGRPISEIYDACLCDVEAYLDGGMNGLIVESHHDEPLPEDEGVCPEILTCLSVVTDRIVRAVNVPVGVNVRANAPISAIAVATAAGADFIRVHQWAGARLPSEGNVQGRAGQALRYRTALGAGRIKVFADSRAGLVDPANGSERSSIAELAQDLASLDADAMILTGRGPAGGAGFDGIGEPDAVTALPLLVDAGVTPDNVADILGRSAGVIVAASLKRGGDWRNEVELERVLALTRAVDRA